MTLLCIKKKNKPALLRRTTSKHRSVNYLYNRIFFHNKTNVNLVRICKKGFFNVVMSSENAKILEFNQYQKSDKAPFIIYADLERLIENINGCKNNPEKSSTTKLDGHVPSGLSMSTISSFKSIENRNVVCRGIDLANS